MKTASMSLLVLGLLAGAQAFAQKPADLPACTSIVKSCEAAGFEPGEHKANGKGLWVDCVGAIANGKTVAGVTATQAEAKACHDAAKAHHKEHGKKK